MLCRRYLPRLFSSSATAFTVLRPFPPSIAVGISGGVDSSVTALLLQAAGFDVRAVFMRNWDSSDEAGSPVCTITDDLKSARAVCEHLGLRIPLHEVSFVQQYWQQVFEPFLEAYRSGKTPNPDVACNQHVKFDAFRQHCLAGADLMATGHYASVYPPPIASELFTSPQLFAERLLDGLAKTNRGGSSGSSNGVVTIAEALVSSEPLKRSLAGLTLASVVGSPSSSSSASALVLDRHHQDDHPTGPALLASVDKSKDQSDFLCRVSGQALKRVVLPLGGLEKSLVRELASAAGLPTASRKDSYGICFIGKRRSLSDFLGQYLPFSSATIRDIETGEVLGTTDESETFTIGQRAKIGGAKEAFFVVGLSKREGQQADEEKEAKASSAAPTKAKTSSAQRGKRATTGPAHLEESKDKQQQEQRRPSRVIWVAKGHANPSVLFSSCAVRLSEVNWSQPLPLPSSSIKVPSAFAGLVQHALSRPSADPIPITPSLAVRYRIRHRQTDFHCAEASILRRSEWLKRDFITEGSLKGLRAFEARLKEQANAAEQDAARLKQEEERLKESLRAFRSTPSSSSPSSSSPSASLKFKLSAVSKRARAAELKAEEAEKAAEAEDARWSFTRGISDEIRSAVVEGLACPDVAASYDDDGGADELLLVVRFNKPQRAVAPGQELVLYCEDKPTSSSSSSSIAWKDAGRQLIGGGPVWAPGPTWCFSSTAVERQKEEDDESWWVE